MRKSMRLLLMVLVIAALMAGGCSGWTENSNPPQSAERTITDLTGNKVVIPPADKINHVVIVAPPLVSTYASVVKDTRKLVGIHPIAISDANRQILEMIVPNWQEINTTFLTGFASNAEELLKLNPDIILVYGSAQKEGLGNINSYSAC